MLGVLCIIGCPVQLIREVFSILRSSSSSTRICLALRRLLTFCLTLMRYPTWWFVCPLRSSFKRLLRSAILISVFVNRSSFKSVLNLCKAYIFKSLLKVFYRSVFNESSKAFIFQSVLKVYTLSKILLWIKPSYFSLENACYSWCMHQTGLFSSASVVPQSKFTGELWSSASVVPQSKSTELCS